MKVLVIGSGGREHAIAWKISKSPLVKKIYVAPGNGGTEDLEKTANIDIKATHIDKLCDFAIREKIDLTVVGPEDPLSSGITDLFRKKGLKIFGPVKNAARLEASKGFAKDFMKRHRIPTPDFGIFESHADAVLKIENTAPPYVIKADGLALGKGVKICQSKEEALKELHSIMVGKSLGEAGSRVIIDEFIDGPEISYLSICDGTSYVPLASSQDNKRLLDGDAGPNTGGMGAYSPIPWLSKGTEEIIRKSIVEKTLSGMRDDGTPFSGTLYAGIIFRGKDPLVLEYNARFGDPETQPLLFRMKSDLVPVLDAAASGNVGKCKIEWEDEYSVCIVMASGGYPGEYKKGVPIEGLDIAKKREDAIIFHAGTILKEDRFYTNGGRVLGVCAKDKDPVKAKEKAIQIAEMVRFEGAHFRKDIGDKLISHKG